MSARIPTIVLVHTGPAAFPPYLGNTLSILRRIAPKSNLVLLCDERFAENHLIELPTGCALIPIESIPKSADSLEFEQRSQLPRGFRDGFWYATSSRFLILADYMRYFEVEDVIHLENDVLLYFDPAEKLDAFRQYADFAVPLDRARAIAGIVWLAHPKVASGLVRHMQEQPDINDMDSLGRYCMANPGAKPLPTLPAKYTADHGLEARRYSEGLEYFDGVFDAAAIGQYIGGVHWLNEPNDSRFFVNESSDLDLRKLDLSWDIRNGVRSLSLAWGGEHTDILAIHAHSKDVAGISPFNHGVPVDESEVLTGERIQALADLTISVAPVTQFHGRDNIQSKALLEIAQGKNGAVFVPDQHFIDECGKARTIFVYTHLLPYFKAYVAPRLNASYRLITHNSDHGIGFGDLDFLNQPMLEQCWGQNCEISHTRLSPLPIGLANRQWGDEKIGQLIDASRNIRKTLLLYVNLSPTHPSRQKAIEAAGQIAGATFETGKAYQPYLAALAAHKFCLCPRGNGLDTHRFWEALYLDTIPVIIKDDWTSAYAELPVLVLDNWEALSTVNLQQAYLRIKATAFSFSRLFLGYYRNRIVGEQ